MRRLLVPHVAVAFLLLIGLTAAAAGLQWFADGSHLTDKGEYHAPPTRCFGARAPDVKQEHEPE